MGFSKKDIRERFIIAFPILIGIGALIASFLTQNQIKTNSKNILRESLATVRDLTEQSVREWYLQQSYIAKTWAQNRTVVELTKKLRDRYKKTKSVRDSKELSEMREILNGVSKAHGYLGFFIINKNYHNIGSSRDFNLDRVNLTSSQPAFLEKIFSGTPAVSLPLPSDIPIEDQTGVLTNITMFIGAPIFDGNDIVGALTFRLDPRGEFSDIFLRGRMSDTGETYAINKDGLLISESRFPDQLASIGLIEPQTSSILKIAARNPGFDLVNSNTRLNQKKIFTLPLTKMAKELTSKKLGYDMEGYRDYRGVKVVGTWKWVDDFDFGITTEIDVADGYRDFFTYQKLNLVFTSLIVIFLFYFSYILYQSRANSQIYLKQLNSFNQELEERVQEAVKEANQANHSKSQFLANMSHEIRTPMNGVVGMIQVLQNTPLNQKQKDYLHTISESAENLLVIINDILDISKIESGKFEIDNHFFDFRKSVKTAIGLLEARAQEKSIDLVCDLDSSVPNAIYSDSTRIRQVLLNLVGNAIKFTNSGSVILKVSYLQTNNGLHKIYFEVEDTGMGIPNNKLKDIFNPFSQADSSTTRNFGGTGLGLPISKSLVELLGGNMTVESQVEKGTTFRFYITPSDVSFEIHEEPSTVDSSDIAELNANSDATNLKILVAEDIEINRQVVEELLNIFNLSADYAKDGNEAVLAFRKTHYDLIFMDVQMPVMDGLEATRQIVEYASTTGLPKPMIYGLTANAFKEDVDRCIAAGMIGHLAKPITKRSLQEAIARSSSYRRETKAS